MSYSIFLFQRNIQETKTNNQQTVLTQKRWKPWGFSGFTNTIEMGRKICSLIYYQLRPIIKVDFLKNLLIALWESYIVIHYFCFSFHGWENVYFFLPSFTRVSSPSSSSSSSSLSSSFSFKGRWEGGDEDGERES